jgi:outer membrane receptor protein involved in Fe transport
MFRRVLSIPCLLVLIAATAMATIFGAARGVVHDAQHRPIQGAAVTLQARAADWSLQATSDANGEFLFLAVPLGEYSITVRAPNFADSVQPLTVTSGSEPVLHFLLAPAGATETVTVSAETAPAVSSLSTTLTVVDRSDIAETPGASRPNSLAMITGYVPGAYITHDQLHVRGGHQTSWLIDGVPIPNTNIASNLGPQFAPGDIDTLEVNRGAYGAEFGDRTYGVFNIVPRTGFERNRQAELVLSAGSFYQTNDQFSLGDHTSRFAYYASLNGNRSNLGLQPPFPRVVHDAQNGFGGFASLIFNLNPSNQLRVIAPMRRDFYQIPYDPFPGDIENNPVSGQFPSIGLRDAQHESDVLLNASWVHTFNSRLLLTLSPFYHYNRADYQSSPRDFTFVPPNPAPLPDSTTQQRGSTYAGGQFGFDATLPRNHLQAGSYGFYQSDSQGFGAGGQLPFTSEHPSGSLVSFFADDKFKLASWLTLTAGVRPTFFSGNVTERAISPRFGAAVTIPRLHCTLRGFYGHYYQAPPLITASGPLLQFATANNLGFVPLHGERDEEFQFGLYIPYRGWALDADTSRNRVVNFFDHNNIGESNLFFPITIQSALIRAWELTLRSPRLVHRLQFHLAYSNQVAQAGGTITGGLEQSASICPAAALCPLDHDQRNTLSVGGDVLLPWHSHASTNVYYGSGFTNGQRGRPYPGPYLPAHTTFDLSLAKDFGEHYSLSLTALNVANRRVELDNSLTFGGFHWNSPRELYAEIRYRFHY